METVSLFNLKRRLFIVNADLALSRSCHSRCLTNTKVEIFWILKNIVTRENFCRKRTSLIYGEMEIPATFGYSVILNFI